jgi:hypothetical protein
VSQAEPSACDDPFAMEHRDMVGEARDTDSAITLWYRKATEAGPPLVSAFDLSRLASDWSYRFLIAGDKVVADAVFLVYGTRFARLLDLPAKPLHHLPVLKQVPTRYQTLFGDGYSKAMMERAPARFSGAVSRCDGKMELYRAAFMPVQGARASTCLVLGTFNCRTVAQVSESDAFQRTQDQWSDRVRKEGASRSTEI